MCMAGSIALTGCDDFLTPDNKSSVTDVEYFTTADGFQSLVNDAYAQLSAIFNSSDVTTYFNAGTDMYQDGRKDNDAALHRWSNFTPENGIVKNFYTDCYDGLRACLAIQYYAPNAAVNDDVRQKAIDEGRFVESLYYYLLVNNYGGVPLIAEYADTAVKGYPRATAEDVYTHIIETLKSIISNNKLVASSATKGGGEASIEAAKALLAKTYLSAAWDLNNNAYFTEAAKLADEVIDGRSLTTKFADLWAADRSGDDDPEFIFDLEYDYETAHDQNTGNRWQSFYCGYYGGSEEGMKNGSSNYVPYMHTLRYFEEGDERYDATFMKTLLVKKYWGNESDGFKENGTPIGDYFSFYKNGNTAQGKMVGVYFPAYWLCDEAYVNAWRAEDPANRQYAFIIPQSEQTAIMEPMSTYREDLQKFPNGIITKYDFAEAQKKSWAVMPCRKFDDSQTALYDAGKSFRDLHIITLPEMFFVAAEAYYKLNDPKALDRLNSVRERANLSDITSIDLDAILKESACEMFGNGYRRMDLRRMGKLVEYNNLYNPHLQGSAANIIGEKLLWPIPQAAIDANEQLTIEDQNPGY